jgi:ribosomal protein S18 acetylase RimI-like enzyme
LSKVDWTRSGVLVADTYASLLGFIYYSPTRDQDADPGRIGEIYSMYVVPDAWGKWIGRQLMDTALKRLVAAGDDQVSLWVLDTNTRARRFYEAGGWHADGAVKRDDTFGLPVTLMRYRKPLP